MTTIRVRLIWAVASFVLLALVPGVALATSAGGGAAPGGAAAEVEVIAHRGSSAMAPENTLAAARMALRQGADSVETDVVRTKDDQLVILHDLSLARTTNVEQIFPDRAPWRVADFTLAEVKRLDAGSWFSTEYAGERVPTLREWVATVGSRAAMLIEVKKAYAFPGIEHELDGQLRSSPIIRQAQQTERVIVQAGDQSWLRRYHRLAPEMPVALLHYGAPTDQELVAGSRWLDAFNPELGNTTPEIVERIHELGMDNYVWTVNDEGEMARAIAWGVDGVITDRSSVLRGRPEGAPIASSRWTRSDDPVGPLSRSGPNRRRCR